MFTKINSYKIVDNFLSLTNDYFSYINKPPLKKSKKKEGEYILEEGYNMHQAFFFF